MTAMKPGEIEFLTGLYLVGIGAALMFGFGQSDKFLLFAGGCFAIIGSAFNGLSEYSREPLSSHK